MGLSRGAFPVTEAAEEISSKPADVPELTMSKWTVLPTRS